MKYLVSTATYLLANAIGLAMAALLLTGFQISFLSFLLVVLVFSVLLVLAEPLLKWVAGKTLPQAAGGISLVAIFLGLFVTDSVMAGLTVGGISNWLAATLLIWLGSMLAMIVIPRVLARSAAAP